MAIVQVAGLTFRSSVILEVWGTFGDPLCSLKPGESTDSCCLIN